MDYSYEQFAALAAEVEAQCGSHLPDECVPVTLEYKVPGSERVDEVNTCHCGNESIFVTVYEPETSEARALGSGFVRACAVCDAMGAWPRYEGAIA